MVRTPPPVPRGGVAEATRSRASSSAMPKGLVMKSSAPPSSASTLRRSSP
jgi:hypothetical protein